MPKINRNLSLDFMEQDELIAYANTLEEELQQCKETMSAYIDSLIDDNKKLRRRLQELTGVEPRRRILNR